MARELQLVDPIKARICVMSSSDGGLSMVVMNRRLLSRGAMLGPAGGASQLVWPSAGERQPC